jgi:hypothetical protein
MEPPTFWGIGKVMRIAVPAWLLPLLASCFLAAPALAQQPLPGAWGGWARCVVTVQGPGYNDQQTHTWTIAGGAPAAQGAFLVHAGTWSVVGRGSLSRSQGNQTFTAQWATNGPETSGPIAVFVRASDNRMFIQARHSQLRSRAAIQGFQQLTIAGVPQTPGRLAAEAFEYSFPVIAVSAPVPPSTNATAIGSSVTPLQGSYGVMQPGGSAVTAACNWNFAQGDAAPAPAPVLAAQTVPSPGNPATVPPANTMLPPVSAATASPPATTATTTPPFASTTSPPANTATTTPPSASTTTSPPPASSANSAPPAMVAVPLATGVIPAIKLCTLRGPAIGVGTYATPAYANLRWDQVSGAESYTVSRSDLGVLGERPRSNNYFGHAVLLPHPGTYVYTVTANYPEGCGRTDITLHSQEPRTPDVHLELTNQPGMIRLEWSWPPGADYAENTRDYTGILVTGPGLAPAGREVRRGSVGGDGTQIEGVPSGTRTWTIKAYWEAAGGRIIDNTGSSVTGNVP